MNNKEKKRKNVQLSDAAYESLRVVYSDGGGSRLSRTDIVEALLKAAASHVDSGLRFVTKEGLVEALKKK